MSISVLVVEDHPKTAALSERGLQENGFAVDVAMAAGADDFLGKPFAFEELLGHLERLSGSTAESSSGTEDPSAHLPKG